MALYDAGIIILPKNLKNYPLTKLKKDGIIGLSGAVLNSIGYYRVDDKEFNLQFTDIMKGAGQ
jgi:hypothetical protein